MKTNHRRCQARLWTSAAALLVLTGAPQAALIDLRDGTVKDDKTNLIWLQDWNDAGQDDWRTQMNWADKLSFAGSSAWRLPEIGEYTALFSSYGVLTGLTAFVDVQSANGYWSATPNGREKGQAGHFDPVSGAQAFGNEFALRYAVAVRLADPPAPVPEPQSLALALLALGAVALARRPAG